MQKKFVIKSISYKLGRLTLAILCAVLVGCSGNAPKDFYRIYGLKTDSNASKINNIRSDALKQTARGLGAQAGLAWRAQQLNKILENQKHHLDQIFNFNYILLSHNALPPVLTEGDNTLNLANAETIRISDRDYQIVAAPRFVTAPPSWRNYIMLNYKKPEIPNSTLLPKDGNEAKIWNKFTQIGWNEGIEQADQIFNSNLARLKRDYNGMLLYRKLLAQNMISPPFVSQADLGVTGGGATMRINDRVLRITASSELKPNTKVWTPALVNKKIDDDSYVVHENPDKLGS